MTEAHIRYFAAARQALRRSEESLSGADSLADIVKRLSTRDPAIARLLSHCSFLVDGTRREPDHAPLPDGAVVDVLPPFAGG
ncbi:MAG: MoaD/ThiS family protein [Propionibacteriaceae bacterium]|jgi:molybdopterin converting factor small subunit|nr:MoaD/ThiS family protein [Propionibacteriaceae bacterium]